MKPIIERLSKHERSSFVLQKDVYPYYPTPWHYHPEYELVLVLKSTGKKIIGDNISNFTDGDLAFIGPNLPHVYHNDNIYYQDNPNLAAEAIVVHFTIDFPVRNFFDIPEMKNIKAFLDGSLSGYSIVGNTQKTISKKMNLMFSLEGTSRFLELITILDILAKTREKKQLSSPGFSQNFKISGSEQITKACDYIIKNFSDDITLSEVSKVANMSPNAFCNFFKSRTRKTFVTFLNEIRIGYACKLLSEGQYNISEISYQSGFQNLSNFNRQFKKIVKKTPNHYKLEMLIHNK